MDDVYKLAKIMGICIFFQSCATARVVKSQPKKGGVIAVHEGLGFDGSARDKAMKIARGNCGKKKVEVIEEGEAVVGSTTSSSSSGEEVKGKKDSKSFSSSGSSETSQKTEWRITYKCS